MDSGSGVTINTSAHVVNNLSVAGSLVVGTMNIVTEITNLQNSSGGGANLSNYYTKTESDNLLNAKQNTITDRGGTGSVLLLNGILSRIYGLGDIDVSMTLNLNNLSDPTNYNIKVDGTTLKTAIQAKQDLLTTSSNIDINNLTSGKILTNTLSSSSGAKITVLDASNNTIGIFGNDTTTYGGPGNYMELDVNNNIRSRGIGSNRGRLYVVSQYAVGSEIYFGGGYSGNSVPDWSFFANPNGSLQIWKVGDSEVQIIDVNRFTGMVTFNYGHQNASDRILKDNVEDVPENDAINALKNISAKTYVRTDLTDNKRRIGYIAQDFENLPTTLGENLVGKATHSNNRDDPETEITTLAYDRANVILWQCCRNLLKRIEALETKLNSS